VHLLELLVSPARYRALTTHETPDSNAAAVKKYGARMRRRLKAKAIRAVLYVPSKIGGLSIRLMLQRIRVKAPPMPMFHTIMCSAR
jgi:hypothetical protein